MADPHPALTEPLQNALDCVALFTTVYGYPPTVSEVAAMLREPKGTAYSQLLRLLLMGLIVRLDNTGNARNIGITDAGREQCSMVEWIA